MDNIQSIKRARDPFSYGRARLLVGFLWGMTVLGLVAALGILGVALYVTLSEYAEMLHTVTKLALYAAAASVAVLSAVGMIGLHKRSRTTIMAYLMLVCVIVAFQLGILIFYVGWREEAATVIDSMWAGSTPEWRNEVQEDLECCGLRSLDDYPGPNCQPHWTTPCGTAIYELLWSKRVYILVVLILTLLVEFVSIGVSAYLIYLLPSDQERNRLDIEEEWLKSLGVNDDADDDDANELYGIY